MFQVSHTNATTVTTRLVLALAAAAALSAAPVGSATASRMPDPSADRAVLVGWQDTVHDIAAEARSTTSLAGHRMLHAELTIVLHSHRVW